MDMTSTSAAVATVFAAFGGLLALVGVLANGMRGTGERPCEGRRRREEAARIARAAEILETESATVSYEAVVAIVAQRQAPTSVRK